MHKLNLIILGQRIRQARENCGLSQEELAAEIALDQRSVSQLESGKRRLIVTELPNLARALDVPIAYFFDEEVQTTNLDELLLNVFHQLPSEEWRQTAIEMITLLSKTLQQSTD